MGATKWTEQLGVRVMSRQCSGAQRPRGACGARAGVWGGRPCASRRRALFPACGAPGMWTQGPTEEKWALPCGGRDRVSVTTALWLLHRLLAGCCAELAWSGSSWLPRTTGGYLVWEQFAPRMVA